MPFTLSHVAAILPLTGRRSARWFSSSALAIGAMVPDVVLFVPGVPYGWTHAPWGVVSIDLLMGLGLVAL